MNRPTLKSSMNMYITEYLYLQHSGFPWPEFPRCQHGPCAPTDWIAPGTTAAGTLHTLVNDRKLIKELKRCCAVGDTSDLEAFHSLLNHYCRKMTHVGSRAMMSRTLLAVMDFNENVERTQAVDLSGKPRYARVTRKYLPGEAVLRPMKPNKTFRKYKIIFCHVSLQ